MRRPFALVGFTVLPALAAAVFIGEKLSLVCACIFLVLSCASVFIEKFRCTGVIPLVLLTASLSLGMFSGYAASYSLPAKQFDGQDAGFTGTVVELPEQQNGRFYYIVRLDELSRSGLPAGMKIRLSSQNTLNAGPYSQISGRLHFSLPSGGEGFATRSSYASKGIFLTAFLYEYEDYSVMPPQEKPLYYYALQLRSKMAWSFYELLPQEDASFLNAVLLGDKSGLSDSTTQDFRSAGVSHVMAVSGLHMAVILQLILGLLSLLHLPKRLSLVLAALGVLGFMAVTCFAPSVVRSGIMCFIYLAGLFLSKNPDTLNSLGLAVFVICLMNPYASADVGLLLSFSATLGILLLSRPFSGWLIAHLPKGGRIQKIGKRFGSSIGVSLSAILFTLPVSILSFGSFSLAAPFANLVEVPLCSAMLPLTALAGLTQLLLPQMGVAMIFAIPAAVLSRAMRLCANWLAQFSFSSFSISGGHIMVWMAAVAILLAVSLFLFRLHKSFRVTACLAVILLLVDIASFQFAGQGSVRVAVLNAGTGIAVVVTNGNNAAVIGCGGYSAAPVLEYLKSQEIQTLDTLQLLTNERQEIRNAAQVLEAFPVDKVLLSSQVQDGFLEKQMKNAKEWHSYGQAAATGLWGRVTVQVVCGTAQIRVDGITVLLVSSQDKNARLPTEFLNSEFAILSCIPKNVKDLTPRYAIFCMSERDFAEASFSQVTFPALTPVGGKLVLQTRPGREFEIRWES